MDSFDHLVNWKLKAGSHPFPGPDGGTCINEAALVAAGFAYEPIRSVDRMPECFSRSICRLAMMLNDQASHEDRQRLLPFVTRLACADTPEVEVTRTNYIHHYTRGYLYGLPFDVGLKVLEGALAIGRQADPLGLDETKTRMDEVRAQARAAVPPLDRPFFSKVKSWLTMKETEAAT